MTIPVPSFWENETVWAQEHRVYFTWKSLHIHCLSYTFSISEAHFHEEWVGHVLSMQIPVHFRIGRERQKNRKIKTYVSCDISYCDSFPCPCSYLPSTVTCWRLASSQESESMTPGHDPGPSTQADQIKMTHKGRFVLLWISFCWMRWGWKVGKARLWKWAKDLKHLVDSVILSVLENALGVCCMSPGNV